MQPIADRTVTPKAKNSVVIGSLLAQQYVEDVPALATAVASSWLLYLLPAVICRDAIAIDQPLTRLGTV